MDTLITLSDFITTLEVFLGSSFCSKAHFSPCCTILTDTLRCCFSISRLSTFPFSKVKPSHFHKINTNITSIANTYEYFINTYPLESNPIIINTYPLNILLFCFETLLLVSNHISLRLLIPQKLKYSVPETSMGTFIAFRTSNLITFDLDFLFPLLHLELKGQKYWKCACILMLDQCVVIAMAVNLYVLYYFLTNVRFSANLLSEFL